MMFVPPRIS